VNSEQIQLGIGDSVTIRLPTRAERAALGIGADELVGVVHHADRPPDVIAADDMAITPRPYGVRAR
jgi:hypothetical protein